jgi:Protein of unknown function (DUF1207)
MTALALILAIGGPAVAAEGDVLPRDNLFSPLLADPRFPHFSGAWQNWDGDKGFNNVGAASLGGSLPIYQQDALGGRWEVGVKGDVFAVFDLDSSPKALINADYRVGLPLVWRDGDWSGFFEVLHQSSHLGDQYLLSHAVQRIEVSWEAVNVVASRFLFDRMVRLYCGGMVLFDRTPTALKPLAMQAGVEIRPPWEFGDGLVHPIAAFDLQATQTAAWEPSLSGRAGLEIQREPHGTAIQLTFDWYRGRNLNGQFFFEDHIVQYWGVGLHAFF